MLQDEFHGSQQRYDGWHHAAGTGECGECFGAEARESAGWQDAAAGRVEIACEVHRYACSHVGFSLRVYIGDEYDLMMHDNLYQSFHNALAL